MHTETQLLRRIRTIQARLAKLGPMRSGSLSKQYNVCGTPGCRCKDPDHPRKHGPYYHLNFAWGGRSQTEFVKPAAVAGLRKQLAAYKRFRALTNEWVEVSIELAKLRRSRSDED